MSIPRLAIARPVTMFMLSFVVVLLGGISLTRLPLLRALRQLGWACDRIGQPYVQDGRSYAVLSMPAIKTQTAIAAE